MSSDLHLRMFSEWRRRNSLTKRLLRTFRPPALLYGLEWGDPETVPPLRHIRDRFVLPYVNQQQVALEIGPGGGRWTQYLLGFAKVLAVDFHQQVLDQLKRDFRSSQNIVYIKNNGSDLPGIGQETVDFAFSFGIFVHLDFNTITSYLQEIRRVIKCGGNVVIQYSDKTKIMAQLNEGFSDNDPDKMRQAVTAAGFQIIEEDTTSLWHSAVIRCTPNCEHRGL